MLLDTGHSALQLSQATTWSDFTVPDPILLERIGEDKYMFTGNENSCVLLEMSHAGGFERVASFESENSKVTAVCLLNSGV